MRARVANVVFDIPGETLEAYSENARSVGSVYAALLGLRLLSRADIYRELNYPADEGDELDPIVQNRDGIGFAFEREKGEYRPPRWPDPDHPQQVHLDIEVGDLDAAEKLVLSHGATRLHDAGDYRVFADPASHPFCLYGADDIDSTSGRMARIVFDCFSPRALAAFYEELLDMRTRVLDTPGRVEIASDTSDGSVALAFQHSPCQAPRWPDPAYPAQLHLDIAFADDSGRELAERLGAMRRLLPERPDIFVYADPAGHPFCMGIGGWGTYGPAQVAEYEAWVEGDVISLGGVEQRR